MFNLVLLLTKFKLLLANMRTNMMGELNVLIIPFAFFINQLNKRLK